MTRFEAKNWVEEFSLLDNPKDAEVLIFAPFTLLDVLSGYVKINDLPIQIGAQDISPFDSGAYTGEINAEQIKEFASFVLIGHSERRLNFSETNEIVNKKIEKALSVNLKVMVCVSELDQVKALETDNLSIAYEPLSAIGSGDPENPQDVIDFVNKIKEIKNVNIVYGGSVNSNNVNKYTSLNNINGVLVGSASLEAKSFSTLINNAF